MAGRQTRGRQRIPMRLIESQDDLYASFSKRRQGLYKKASELSTLCGVDIGLIIFSPTDNPHSFFHPNMESVVDRYRNPDHQPLNPLARAVESHTRSRIENLNGELDRILEEKDKLKEELKHLDEIDKTRDRGWWETPIESLNRQQVREWMAWFQAFKTRIDGRIGELNNGGSTSGANQQRDPPDVPGQSAGAEPSIFAPGPSYAPDMGTEGSPSQFFCVPLQAGDRSSGGGSGNVSGQYFYPQLPQDSSSAGGFILSGNGLPGSYFLSPLPQGPYAGGESGHVGGEIFFPSPPSEGPFLAGGSGLVPDHYFLPPLPQDPSGGGSGLVPGQYFLPLPPSSAGGGNADPTPGQYGYVPRPTQNPSTAGQSEEATPPHQGQGGN